MDGTADGRTPVEVGDPEGAEHRIAHQTTKVGHSSKMDTADALIEQQVQARLFSRDVTTRIGRYRVVEHIGHGGMGRVYAAMDEELDRKVAVKVLLDDDLPSESIRLRFRREAQALARLSHPHVVTVYEVGETRDGQLFLAMEFIRGQSLDAWLKTEPGWRDVLDAFIQGGEGLAAAHHADLVHRDLKPSNLMRSEDGVVKVLDFGLARIDSEEPSYPAGDYQLSDHSGSHPTSPTSPLTRPGAIMGTPAYMSPEQLAGTFVDAASDQYSFCVSLFEALYGERPTVYDSTDDLQESVRRKAAASSNGLPSLLSAAVLRGLEPDPADRWPSMEALLVELRKPLAPRTRSKIAIVASVVTLGLGGSWAFGQYMQVKDRCTGAEAKLVGVWDEQRRGEVKAALVGTELVYASSTWERVESRLDEHARAWVEHHTEACEATAVRKEQSAKTLELRMGCLQDQVTELRAAVEVLADADETVVQNAVALVSALSDHQRCDDVEALGAALPPPDPAVADEVETLRGRLQAIHAEQRAGRVNEALEQIEPVVNEAEKLGYAPLVAEVRHRLGALQRNGGQNTEAEQELRKAYALAIENRHDYIAFEAALELTFLVGNELARHVEGHIWSEAVTAHAKRNPSDLNLSLATRAQGSVYYSQGKYAEAKTHYEESVELLERSLGPEHLELTTALNSVGSALIALGDSEQATHRFERALHITEQALGPDHPAAAANLANLGIALRQLGEYDRAKIMVERSLRVRESAFGADNPDVVKTRSNLCVILSMKGEYEQAHTCHERTLRDAEKVLEPTHPFLAHAVNNLAISLHQRGELEQAGVMFERSLQIKEQLLGPDHPDLAIPLANLGTLLGVLGEHERGRQLHERAIKILETALGPEHRKVGERLGGLGEMLYRQGEIEDAISYLERAIGIMETTHGPEHPDLAPRLTALGAAYRQQGQIARAKAMHGRALAILEATHGSDNIKLADTLTNMAVAMLEDEEFETARGHAERAVALREKHDVEAPSLALSRFTLARALWRDTDERPRARALALQARDALEPSGEQATQRQEVEQWLEQHAVR